MGRSVTVDLMKCDGTYGSGDGFLQVACGGWWV